MRPNALFLTPRLPFPLVGGDRVKAFHLLKILSQRYRVTCISFVEGPPAEPSWLRAIEALGVELHTVPLNTMSAFVRVARTIASDKPLEIQYYTHPRFAETVERVARQQPFDLVVAFFMRTAEYALLVPDAPRILVAEDARVLMQERATAHFSMGPGYFMRLVERGKLRRYEPSIVNAFDVTTFVSSVDRARIQQMNPLARTAIVTNGVDLDEFPFHNDQSSRKGIVFAGKMDVLHNVTMALRIGNEIFPALRAQYPDMSCTIVGKNPPAAVRRLERAGVTVTGEVAHVGDHVAAAAVFLHPQELGAGIQNKLLEAMAIGTPVVTTPIGISGIAAQDGVHALIATDTPEIVRACSRLLDSAELRSTISRNARTLVETKHTWAIVGEQLDAAIASCTHSSSKLSPVTPLEPAR